MHAGKTRNNKTTGSFSLCEYDLNDQPKIADHTGITTCILYNMNPILCVAEPIIGSEMDPMSMRKRATLPGF
jgi:hypothetical protein